MFSSQLAVSTLSIPGFVPLINCPLSSSSLPSGFYCFRKADGLHKVCIFYREVKEKKVRSKRELDFTHHFRTHAFRYTATNLLPHEYLLQHLLQSQYSSQNILQNVLLFDCPQDKHVRPSLLIRSHAIPWRIPVFIYLLGPLRLSQIINQHGITHNVTSIGSFLLAVLRLLCILL